MIKLVRVEESGDGSFGVLMINGEAFCVTLEPPDRDNQSNVSNIPPGLYPLVRIQSPKYGIVFEVQNVPNRTHILIHPGNFVEDTKGCIILAQYFGKLKGDRAVLNSGKTFRDFMHRMEGVDSTSIEIIEATYSYQI